MNLLAMHMILAFCWGIFLITLLQSLSCAKRSKLLAFLSSVCMLAVLGVGTKIMLMIPSVAKSGNWIHIKLLVDIFAMIINLYALYVTLKGNINQKLFSVLFWVTILMFISMYYLTLYKPF